MRKSYAIPGILTLMCVLVFCSQAFGQAPRFKSAEEKAAWIAKNPGAQEAAPAKLQADPAVTKAMTPQFSEISPKKAAKAPEQEAPKPVVAPASQARTVIVRPSSGLPAGHPVYTDTGSPTADEAAYARAKETYYAEQNKKSDPDAVAKMEKEKHIAEEAERMRLLEIEEAAKKASENSSKSDQ